jgi:uncharacterized protein (TIGR04255 family)
MWRMFHTTNAIEAMVISAQFTQEVSQTLINRMIREVERLTTSLGMIDRQNLTGFHVRISNDGPVSQPTTLNGVQFQRRSLVKNGDGAVEQALVLQFEISPGGLTFQTWRYESWEKELPQALKLLTAALNIAANSAAIASLRVEYLDRFVFEGDPNDANVSDLLKSDSKWLAPFIFDAGNLWHCHVGRFADIGEKDRKLLLVNVDAQDLTRPDNLAGRRSLMMVTVAEKQFVKPGWEMEPGEISGALQPVLENLHNSAIELFSGLMNQEFAKKNGLPHV